MRQKNSFWFIVGEKLSWIFTLRRAVVILWLRPVVGKQEERKTVKTKKSERLQDRFAHKQLVVIVFRVTVSFLPVSFLSSLRTILKSFSCAHFWDEIEERVQYWVHSNCLWRTVLSRGEDFTRISSISNRGILKVYSRKRLFISAGEYIKSNNWKSLQEAKTILVTSMCPRIQPSELLHNCM